MLWCALLDFPANARTARPAQSRSSAKEAELQITDITTFYPQLQRGNCSGQLAGTYCRIEDLIYFEVLHRFSGFPNIDYTHKLT
jgi:hypothetical protein